MPRNTGSFDAITSNGYRPGFEPRPGETEAQRLKREMAFLKAESDRKAAERRKKQQEERTSPYGGPSLFNYRAPVAPQAGYRRGFEPRPGESESERLKREVAWLTAQSDRKAAERRRQQGRAAGGPVSKSKPKPMPMPTDNKRPKPLAKGGATKKYAKGGSVSASRRADGIARKGKTRGKVC